jgi:hypothetical protein
MKRLLALLGLPSQHPLRAPEPSDAVVDAVNAICGEAKASRTSPYETVKLNKLAAWAALKAAPEIVQVEAAVHAAQRNWGRGGVDRIVHFSREIQTALVSQLLRRNLPYTAEHLVYFFGIAVRQQYLSYGFPIDPLVGATERFCAGRPPEGRLKQAVRRLRRRTLWTWWGTNAAEKLRIRVDSLLEPASAQASFRLADDSFGERLASWIDGIGATEREAWVALFRHAVAAADRPRPSRKWLDGAAPIIDAVGRRDLAARLTEWLETTGPGDLLYQSENMLKGLIWASIDLDHVAMAGPLGRFAERCFKKIPGSGPASTKLGNACLVALAEMGDAQSAAAELVRLKTRVKYGTVRGRVENRLAAMAADAGVSVADLEETALPHFDLAEDGCSRTELGAATAVISLGDDGAVLSWRGADGKPRKTVPVAVKREHSADVKGLRQRVKDINDARATQILRLEATWLDDRDWPLDVWKERYLGHPVRRPLARTLIWRFDSPDGPAAAMPADNGFVTCAGADFVPHAQSRVRLWHPMDALPGEIMAWRRRIADAGITQPIRQAHREIYVLTDAERETGIYSNRFAAHILRQHQFRALCHAREWKYDFQGDWDSWNVPTRPVPQRDVTIEYHVEQVEDGEETEFGVALHVATDRVRFVRGDGEAITLTDIPPVVFSEAMRDVDLFVAVTSVANDPDWTDGGPDGRYGAYWRDHAFGELGETAKTRRDLVSAIAPKLAIADRLNVTDRYLEVRGNLGSYRIHLGSGNIQILPDNRYLCIVRSTKGLGSAPAIRLPFAGDSLLSIILSKAFLLAADDRITDPTILSQLDR